MSVIVRANETQTVNIESFLKIVHKYMEPAELTLVMLRKFVGKIVVPPDKSSGHHVQRIGVHYNKIVGIDLSPEYARGTTA